MKKLALKEAWQSLPTKIPALEMLVKTGKNLFKKRRILEMTSDEERLYDDIKLVALKDLKLDPHNVRFNHINRTMKEKEMEDWLYEEEDVRALIKQIIRDERVQQPIYVIQDNDGKYIVKEGNRRTVALRKISKDIIAGKIKNLEKEHFDLVPVLILKGTDHQINVFLGQIHVSGPKEWRAVNKASVIYTLMEKYGDPIESVAEELGMTKGKVQTYYNAFKATQTYGKRYPNDKNYVPKFSYFAELYQSKVLKKWIEDDPTKLDFFIDLVGQNKLLVTYKGVRYLAKIVAAPLTVRARAMTVLDEPTGDIEKAYSVIFAGKESPKGTWKSLAKISELLEDAKYEEIEQAVEDKNKLVILENVIERSTRIMETIVQLRRNRNELAQ